jgi:hypothetical protein
MMIARLGARQVFGRAGGIATSLTPSAGLVATGCPLALRSLVRARIVSSTRTRLLSTGGGATKPEAEAAIAWRGVRSHVS